jgi:hypothetical protein
MRRAATSEGEVTNISAHGFWLLLDGRELFLPFDEFPWFKRAPVEAILRLERPQPGYLYVNLAVDSIEHPERYPLRAKTSGCGRRVFLGAQPGRRGERGLRCWATKSSRSERSTRTLRPTRTQVSCPERAAA